MALRPLLTGNVAKTLKKGIGSMLSKNQGEFRPRKSSSVSTNGCTINQSNKLIGKRMMEYGG
jgi:hypothetical protein